MANFETLTWYEAGFRGKKVLVRITDFEKEVCERIISGDIEAKFQFEDQHGKKLELDGAELIALTEIQEDKMKEYLHGNTEKPRPQIMKICIESSCCSYLV